uniref:Dynein 2 intermediate chain 2 n=1 Tax=Hippocampus comes TaxID=109280 RepID=A0A3Q3DP51_HIPCM
MVVYNLLQLGDLLRTKSHYNSWAPGNYKFVNGGPIRGCQTRAIHSTETGVQTRSSVASSTQTELQDHVTTQFLQDPHNMLHLPGLNDFLRQIEAPVIRELVRNAKSHAFDGFQVNWEEHNQMVS